MPGLLGWLVNSELGERSPRRDLNPERPDTGRVSMLFTVGKNQFYFHEAAGWQDTVEQNGWKKLKQSSVVFIAVFGTALISMFVVLFSDQKFLVSTEFLWKVVVITLVSCLPLYILKYLRRKYAPPSYSKLTN